MEDAKARFYSCRLLADHESGRVRWCIGEQNKWHTKLKRLVFVPVILLLLFVLSFVIYHYVSVAAQKNPKGMIPEDGRFKRDTSGQSIVWQSTNNTILTDPTIERFEKLNRPFLWHNQKNHSEIRKLQSQIMLKYMNPTVNPCQNFYEFSCGNWNNIYSIPPDRATYDTFEMVRENLDYALRDLLEEHLEPNNDTSEHFFRKDTNDTSSAIIKAKNLFKSCMQEDLIADRADKPLRKILKELNHWPIITATWNTSSFDLVWMLAQLRLLNNDVLIGQWVGPDMRSSEDYIIHIDQTSLGLPSREYYLDESNTKYLKAYKAYIVSVATILGGTAKQIERDADDIIEFETKIAQIMASSEERRNLSDIYLRTDVATMSMYFHEFDWYQYLSVVLGRKIDDHTIVACLCVKYLNKLLDLLKITNPRIIQNYLVWRFVRHRTNNLDERFLDAKQKFHFVLFGREKQPPRWQFCVAQVNSNMGMALGSLFVDRYFTKISRSDTIEMTERLEEAFRETLLEKTWIDDNTKEYARMKINEMDLKIGYPDFILNRSRLAEQYYDVKIHPNYFFENILNILRHLTRVEQGRVGTLVNRTVWSTPPAVVNAYYSRNKNQIMFPAGMLQPPFYHRFFPKALNFGGIGVVIGHEITHGFDNKGRLFDHRGNLHLWWRESSIEKFFEKSQCMIDQYNQYILDDIKMSLNGYLTQGENIADNGGLKQSFRAYEKWLLSNPEADETLPELNFTGRQLFFINFAQIWCGQQRIEAARSRLKTSLHAPGIYRVIGVLSNSEEFSRVFKCPINSPMNPEHKCSLW